MSGIELNKVLGAILSAALIAMVVGIIGDALVSPRQQQGAGVAVPDAPAAVPEKKEEKDPPVAALLASADPEAGKRVANKCKACHNFEEGAGKKIGPDLWNIVGREKASVEGFAYSPALQGLEGAWSYEDLYRFVKDPRGYAQGTKMVFAGVKDPEQRADLVAYLRTLSHEPRPLPEPPAEPEKAAEGADTGAADGAGAGSADGAPEGAAK